MRNIVLTALALGLSAATASADWGAIKGQVAVKGDLPKAVKLMVNKDQPHCLSKGDILSERWVVDEKSKGLRWVVAWVVPEKDGKADHSTPLKVNPAAPNAAVPKSPVVIDQPCCKFEPHVAVLRIGQEFVGKNSSPIVHNMFIQSSKEGSLNDNPLLPAGASKTYAPEKFKPHYIPTSISCSIHMWMSAKLFVFDHPHFAITDKDGNFEIKNLPAGKHRLLIWHEEAGWAVKQMGGKGSDGKSVTIEKDKTLDLGKIEVRAD